MCELLGHSKARSYQTPVRGNRSKYLPPTKREVIAVYKGITFLEILIKKITVAQQSIIQHTKVVFLLMRFLKIDLCRQNLFSSYILSINIKVQ